ncbi:MAG: transglutaminase-like cysteine peptidase [Alphaproteobacteria bacterium]|nr:transglutaminase-like cysteine peptidase [Alphaproteobacteria bacterium]
MRMTTGGILSEFKIALQRNRLGELLVLKGLISPEDLQDALKTQKNSKKALGQIFLESAAVSRWQLFKILGRQYVLRTCAATLLMFIALAHMGGKKAHAESIEDVPAKLMLASIAPEFERVSAYPALFGTDEKRSANLSAFTKWTGMFKRFDQDLKNTGSQAVMRQWQNQLRTFKGGSIHAMARKVNDFVNESRYIVDSKNWGRSDYWATPVEFIKRGGDCEDFAIAKYTALRALGVPEERLRVAIVQDTYKNIPHAVLVVYTESGAVVLDNQIKSLVDAERAGRYRPIFSINRTAWWLHSAQSGSGTVVASAR